MSAQCWVGRKNKANEQQPASGNSAADTCSRTSRARTTHAHKSDTVANRRLAFVNQEQNNESEANGREERG